MRDRDVSETGFAVISSIQYSVGTQLPIGMCFEGDFYSGYGSIRSANRLSPSEIRYGLKVCTDSLDSDAGDLADGLRSISRILSEYAKS